MAEDYPRVSIPGLTLVRASPADVPAIKAIVDAAYTKYIERIGKPPAPMLTDYLELLKTHDIFVLRDDASGTILGSIVLEADDGSDAVQLNNLVVGPTAQGKGYGRVLMNFAEDFTRFKGKVAIELYTNVKMYENLTLYVKLGFDETGRKTDQGYERVYFRKAIA